MEILQIDLGSGDFMGYKLPIRFVLGVSGIAGEG
jgi:hypothetical protein